MVVMKTDLVTSPSGLGTVEETLGVDRADKMALETDAVGLAIPCISYSSSDDDEFFDAVAARTSPPPPQLVTVYCILSEYGVHYLFIIINVMRIASTTVLLIG